MFSFPTSPFVTLFMKPSLKGFITKLTVINHVCSGLCLPENDECKSGVKCFILSDQVSDQVSKSISPFVRPVEPLVEPPSPTETTETTEPETVESVEPETGEPTDLGSPTVHVDPKTGKKFVFDIFGDPMSPNTLAALDEFPESPTSPVKQEEEISDMDPWDEFRDRIKVVKLKDFRHLVNSLRKACLSKKRARIRAYNEMLSELQKELRQQYIDHLK